MSPAVIYDTSSPWTPHRSPLASSLGPYTLLHQSSEQESNPPQWGFPTADSGGGFPDHKRSFSTPSFLPHFGVNGTGSPQSMEANDSTGMYSSILGGQVHSTSARGGSVDPSFRAHQNGSSSTGSGQDSNVQSIHPSQLASGNSRSARMRRALSVPTRGVSTPTAASQTLPISDASHSLPPLQSRQAQVIAEFSPRDQVASHPFSPPGVSYESTGNALPPRLQATNPSGGKSRHKSWRPTDEGLPPRFRSPQPSPPRVLFPPESLWDQIPPARTDSPLNHLQISFPPQFSQPQHLSSFLPNNVSFTHKIPHDHWPIQQPGTKPVELSSSARALAPIGAERAQRLASTANIMPSNYCNNSNNLKADCTSHSLGVDPPPGLTDSLPFSFNFVAREPHSRLFQGPYPTVSVDSTSSLVPRKDVARTESTTELEKLFRRTKTNKYAPRIFSPLSPLRNPDSWAPSDGKWRREEREQRRQRTLYGCETSVFRRKTSDQRSRIECEEFAYGLEVSEHCLWCRQDTLCKLLLVHRARESIRSNSSSPLSDYSTSDDGISDDEPILGTPIDSIPRLPVTSTSEKLLEFRLIEVVDADDEDSIAPDSPTSGASRCRVSPVLADMDI